MVGGAEVRIAVAQVSSRYATKNSQVQPESLQRPPGTFFLAIRITIKIRLSGSCGSPTAQVPKWVVVAVWCPMRGCDAQISTDFGTSSYLLLA